MTYNFYDTSSLLLRAKDLFENPEENIIISSVTLTELEGIKTARYKSEEVKYQARLLTHLLAEYPDKYTCWIYNDTMLTPVEHYGANDDIKILATAIDYDKRCHPDETNFITNDLALKNIANTYFGADSIFSVKEKEDNYSGYKEIALTEQEMSKFYSEMNVDHFNLLINQYVILKEAATGNIVDTLRWDGTEHKPLRFGDFRSSRLGYIKPLKDDVY